MMRPIGVFDSGIGGLTVVKELFTTVPFEPIVYFGDTARVPYGTKSVETVRRYAQEDAELLLAHDVKMIVVACNTVSATALADVERVAATARGGAVPVIGMIGPAADEAVRLTRTGHIGVAGTEATVASKAYEEAIARAAEREGKACTVTSVACPLFVPLAEEGWMSHAATELIAREYLAPLIEAGVDTLILGCTHYPILAEAIGRAMGPDVTLVNSGAIAARTVAELLRTDAPPAGSAAGTVPESSFLVSDVPRKFQQIGERFLGRPMPKVRHVMWKESWVMV